MTQDASPRLGLGSPALVRLLAGLSHAQANAPTLPLAERLVQWMGWSDAIALSGALNGAPPAVAADDAAEVGAGQGEYALLRASLTDAIQVVNAQPVRRQGPWGGGGQSQARPVPLDYPSYRQRYVSLQQKMETRIADLRARLRTMLASRTPEMARLALVDAAMEQAIALHEQTALLKVPALLELHFKRLREQAEASAQAAKEADPEQAEVPSRAMPSAGTPAWLDIFRKDMQSVLLAELDLRLQPLEGLLAALRAGEPETL